MSLRHVRAMLCAGCLLLPAAAVAADLIPVDDFARHALLSQPTLSPNGQYIAVNMNDADGDSHALVVFKVDDMTHAVSMLRLPRYEIAAGITWVSNTRLVVEKGKQFGSIDKPYLTGEIIATNLDGKHQDYLYGYQSVRYGTRAGTRGTDEGYGAVDGLPMPTNGHFYMATRSFDDNQNNSALYDVDGTSGSRHLIGQINVGDMSFMVGADGKAHYAYGRNDDWQYVVYHQQAGGWARMTAAQVGGSFRPLFFTPDQHGVYAEYAAAGGPTALVQQDENGSNRILLAGDGFSSVGNIEWTPWPYQPFATIAATGTPRVTYIDPNLAMAKLHMGLSQKLPGYVHFINFSEDGSELLFSVSSDRDPGTYYLINTHNYKVTKLFAVEPWINPARMAERRSMRFKASDGMELEAILTLPNGVGPTDLPMVLLPHGGPIGVQDTWFYDDDAQFLASRGYLVLQVNYRGSGGRGEDFREAGYLKWGTRIQQDLIDGVKWAIAQKYADPKRICVYGASFGGYSAMMTVIRAPGLFKCAVGYAGIYDLAMMYQKGDIHENKSGRSYLREVIGRNAAELDANSPDKLADKIDVPVLLVHGEDDRRAPFAQARAMRDALDAAHKPYEWLVKPGEGHGFYAEANNVEFYNRLQGFLAKYIGPGKTVP